MSLTQDPWGLETNWSWQAYIKVFVPLYALCPQLTYAVDWVQERKVRFYLIHGTALDINNY